MKSSQILSPSVNGILLKRNAWVPSSSEIFILHPDIYTFLCFGTISLIFKHGKLLRRWAIFIKAADWKESSAWNFIKNNTPSPLFKFYNDAYSTKSRYTLHIIWQNLSFHPVFIFPKVVPELRIQGYIYTISSLPPMLLVGTIHYLLVQDI